MFNVFDFFILSPLRLFFQGMYEIILIFIDNYGIAIIGLSCVTALIIIPIEKAVRGSILKEKKIESVLQPQLTEIKIKYSGIEKNNAVKRLYNRYGYSPLYAIRNIYGVLVQLPFLIGAYLMLSSYANLNGQSFLFIKDLSMQDHLLGSVNLLPILMTVVNLSTLLFLNLSKKENIQTTAIAFVFLVLLYTAPSALLLYWTMNNVIHLLRALWKRYICFDSLKTTVTDNVKVLIEQFSKTATGRYLKRQLIDKTESELYKKNWIYFIVLVCLLILDQLALNFGFYPSEQVARTTFCLLLLSLLFIGIFYGLKKLFSKNRGMSQGLLLLLIILGAAVFYQELGYHYVTPLPKILRISIIGFLFLLVYCVFNLKFLNLFLFANILTFIIFGGLQNFNASNDFLNSVKEINSNNSLSIKLKEKPNIYYILCESMNSLDIAQKTYGLDKKTADDFVAFLKKNGFYVPDYVYSNATGTLKTLQTLFLMNDYVGGSKGIEDGSTLVRPMLAGSENNSLLKILKNNGYYTSSYMVIPYFEASKGRYLDFFDLDSSSRKKIIPLMDTSKILPSILYKLAGNQRVYVQHETKDIIETYFEHEPPKPHFMIHRPIYLSHSTNEQSSSVSKRKQWLESKEYLNRYYREIEALRCLTEKIIKNDPDAVIIMIGDHGAHLYGFSSTNIEELKTELQEANISYEDFINDHSKVFAAVRMPKNLKPIDGMFSPGNIFPKIFNNIGYSGGHIKIAPNNAYYNWFVKEDIPVIKKGKIVPLDELQKETNK